MPLLLGAVPDSGRLNGCPQSSHVARNASLATRTFTSHGQTHRRSRLPGRTVDDPCKAACGYGPRATLTSTSCGARSGPGVVAVHGFTRPTALHAVTKAPLWPTGAFPDGSSTAAWISSWSSVAITVPASVSSGETKMCGRPSALRPPRQHWPKGRRRPRYPCGHPTLTHTGGAAAFARSATIALSGATAARSHASRVSLTPRSCAETSLTALLDSAHAQLETTLIKKTPQCGTAMGRPTRRQ